MKCRHCNALLENTFLDLGFAPPSNAYLLFSDLDRPEKSYPLRVMVCIRCWLVQTEDYRQAEDLFSAEYAYFSSTSISYLKHAAEYTDNIINDLKLNSNSLVVEIASNDGYLLKNFVSYQIPCLGIEPTLRTAEVAETLGIPVLKEFFSENLASKLVDRGGEADLVVGNNVYAHVPDINDFTRGIKKLLKPSGTITLEFPHLLKLLQFCQFDTIYHEHFSYLSLFSVSKIFESCGLRVLNVEEMPTHGGSLRVYGCHMNDLRNSSEAVQRVLYEEKTQGLQSLITYQTFQTKVNRIKNNFLQFLIEQSQAGNTVAAYGAAAKGNTLMNYAGVKADLIAFVGDAAIAKQNKFMPGSHIPIVDPDFIEKNPPDFLIIFPWNIADEIIAQNAHLSNFGTRFVIAIPNLQII